MFSDEELKQAVALFYDGNQAPTIAAKGEGLQAEEIIRIAQENNVPLCDNAPLVDLLSQLELGDEIPEGLYIAVAHIIAFAHKLRLEVLGEEDSLEHS
ncbi:EscU/YscU/HrcU family type III secretion system export apparatus switch protein [Agarilytica rhodophyticola]|uniref:EscU/YscU/HrcU family type III secretion system export apparatus switch protein n=1 Tax=Agarilytica rhodophyticola TaxID=1737490 RepID=UPI000B343420|nr:EscU/YscU/HrcU family type III secretion system export apparatus switch protein [Agarilytica rhodophyticola]